MSGPIDVLASDFATHVGWVYELTLCGCAFALVESHVGLEDDGLTLRECTCGAVWTSRDERFPPAPRDTGRWP